MESHELYALWSFGRALEAGERLFASIPLRDQPRWAEAHDAFSELRQHVLVEEDRGTARDVLRYRILFVAEIAAKLTYNASGAPRPFDADTGPWMAATARRVVDHVGSPVFEAQVWRALTEPAAAGR